MAPTISWDETNPADSASRSEGDDRIRELKTQLREVIAVDHVISSSGNGADWGRHNKVTFKVQTSAPTEAADCILLYAKDVSAKAELFIKNEDGTETQLTAAGSFIGGMTNEIRMWSGLLANIPTGWKLCDGAGGTPNLVGKFIRGVNTSVTNPGTTGGSDTITLTTNNLPSHSHTFNGYTGRTGPSTGIWAGSVDTNLSASTSSSTGSGAAFDIKPAYYELAFITRG